MVNQLAIQIPRDKIAEFCQHNQIQRLSLFGSVLRDDFKSDSDVDILVEFMPEKRIGYFGLAGLEIKLTEMLGRKVDLRTPAELSRYFRQQVLDSAQEIYVHRRY
jgi:predicted nucleotidyltransferase